MKDKIAELISQARDCPNCDNSGFTVVQVGCKQYVTRDMAMDACEPSMEGMEIGDDEFEQEQCQWCYETPESKFNALQAILDLIAKELDEVINDNAKKNGNVVPTRHIHDGLGEDIKHKLGVE